MKVWIASARAEDDRSSAGAFRALAALATPAAHALAASPDEADLILFPDCHLLPHDPALRALRRHPLFEAFAHKCLVYDERDLPWLAWPGVYVSMPAQHIRRDFQEPCAYYSVPAAPDRGGSAAVSPDLLFSFAGSLSHRVRRDVLALRDARAVVEDSGRFTFFDSSSPGFGERRQRFHELLARSKFVLCPRGKGTSSIRLYETLAAGRVPVIVADDWVAPEGPDWGSCSLRWPESGVAELPAALAEREGDFDAMSAAARRVHEEWFSPERSFTRIVDACGRLLDRDAPKRFPRHGVRGPAYVRAQLDHARWCTRGRVVRAVRRLRRDEDAGRPEPGE